MLLQEILQLLLSREESQFLHQFLLYFVIHDYE